MASLPRIAGGIDPLVRLLVVAVVLASLLPVTAEYRPFAQGVSNAAIFVLFLLNGLRLPRAEVLRGMRHMRFLLPLSLWCFGAMSLAGWGLAKAGAALALPETVALGLLFLGALFVRSMTIHLVAKGTLAQYRYIEHGAFWAIIALGGIMLLSARFHIPETITGLIGATLIGISLWWSIRHNRQHPDPIEEALRGD